jgi:adenylate cyclase
MNMSSKRKRRALDKIRFSIGAKLITIISFVVIISLGSITVLVSLLVRADLKITAEANNLDINRMSAIEADTLLTNTLSNSRVLIQTINAIGSAAGGSQGSAIKETTDFFWTENPQIAAVFFVIPGRQEQLLRNSQFFISRQLNEDTVFPYIDSQRAALGRAVRGETVLQNATPHFSKAVLALFFPWQGRGVGAVLFSCEDLNSSYGYGVNKSYMINTDGDVLSHADFAVIKEKTTIKNKEFISVILGDSSENPKQRLMEADFGAMQSLPNDVNLGVLKPVWEKVKSATLFVVDKSIELLKKYDILNIKPKEKKMFQYVAYTRLSTASAVVITSIEYKKIFEGIDATTRRNIYLTIAVLSISIIFIWFFSKTISVPIRSLAVAARQIEGGKFDLDLYSKTRDEIGVLTTSFGKMCSALSIFGRFTNKEIAVKAMRGEIKPGGLPKHGTVFFSDIREFTAKSENFTRAFGAEASNKIVFWLNEYFTQMVDCVEKTNGIVDKFIGDAVMAHWGTAYSAGSPRKDAFNCVKAALMMRKALYFMNRERRAGDNSNPSIRIGCGINSGVVTAGQLGSDMRMEYTVIGDPVNLASRIEALTKPLGTDILISEDTWKLVGDKFITEEMPSVSVKGKSEPVRLFAVVNFAGEVKGPQSLNEVRSLLGIEPPDLDKVNINADEKKYKIGEGQK